MSQYIAIRCAVCDKLIDQSPRRCDLSRCKSPEQYEEAVRRYRNIRHLYCGLAGGFNSGKTYYLLALLSGLIEPEAEVAQLLKKLDLKIEFAHDGVRRSFDLLKNSAKITRLAGTQIPERYSAEPYDLLIARGKGAQKKEAIVSIFNSAGEIYERPDADEAPKTSQRHEVHAVNAMLFFVNPLDDALLNVLLENPSSNPRNLNVINTIYRILQLRARTERVSIPLAVNISKFDLLHQYNGDQFHQPYVTAAHIFDEISVGYETVSTSSSAELESFLDKHSKTARPKEIAERFNTVKYFAVAPYGHNKIGTAEKMEPKGVLGPFFWILKKLSVL